MNELEIVLIVWFFSIDITALFTSSTYKFRISYHLLLVLPQENDGKWDQEASDEEGSDSIVFST